MFTEYYDVTIERIARGVYVFHCLQGSEPSFMVRGSIRVMKRALRSHAIKHYKDADASCGVAEELSHERGQLEAYLAGAVIEPSS